MSTREVEPLVAEADGTNEYTEAYEDEMRRLQGRPTVLYTYGERPSLSASIHQALDDIRRGR
jgi:hypothetical protein